MSTGITWPAYARIIPDGEARGTEPSAERTDLEGAAPGDQVDRATAPRHTRTVRWLMETDAEAAACIVWVLATAHRWFDAPAPAPAPAGARARLVDGPAGVALTCQVLDSTRKRIWYGEATLETPA